MYLPIFQSSGRTVTRAVSYQLPTAAAGVQPRVSLWEICCGLVDNGTGLPMSTTVSPVSITPSLLHTHLNLQAAVFKTTSRRSLVCLQAKKSSFGCRGVLERKWGRAHQGNWTPQRNRYFQEASPTLSRNSVARSATAL